MPQLAELDLSLRVKLLPPPEAMTIARVHVQAAMELFVQQLMSYFVIKVAQSDLYLRVVRPCYQKARLRDHQPGQPQSLI